MRNVYNNKYHFKSKISNPHPICDFINYVLYVKHVKRNPLETPRSSAIVRLWRRTANVNSHHRLYRARFETDEWSSAEASGSTVYSTYGLDICVLGSWVQYHNQRLFHWM